MSPLSSTLLWCALQTTLLALLTLVLGSRPWRFGGSSAPLLGLMGVSLITIFAFLPIPWSWTDGLLDRQSATSSQASLEIERDVEAPRTELLPMDHGQPPLISQDSETGANYVAAFMEGLRASTERTQTGWSLSPVSTIVLGLFGIGIIIGTIRLIVGLVATRRLIRTCSLILDKHLDESIVVLQAMLGMKTRVELYETNKLSTAATIGVWRPRILLPTHWREWTDSELNAVLAHELAHIAHGDFAAVLISQLSIVVHFYHPLVHWLAGRLRLEQELAADSVAAQIAGGQVRYVRVLAKLALEHQDRFVGWPARAFLPTRQTFLRRLEMLRDVKLASPGQTPVGKWAAMVAIVVASVALVGLKPPPNRAMAQDSSATAGTQTNTARVDYDLRYLNDEGGLLCAARPAELLASSSMTEVAKLIQELPMVIDLISPLRVELKDLEQMLVAFESPAIMPTSIFVRASKPIGKLSDIQRGGIPTTLAGAEILEAPQGGACFWKPDDRTVVYGSKRDVERWIQGRQVERKLTETDMWKNLKDRPLLVISEGKVMRNLLLATQPPNSRMPMLTSSILSPILDEAQVLGLAVSMDKEWSLVAMAKCTDAKGASIIQETSQAGIVLLKNGLRELGRSLKSQPQTPIMPSDSKKAMETLLSAGTKLADSAKIQTDGGTVSMITSIPNTEVPVASIVSALMTTRKAAERAKSANNLKQIALAFHNHESAFKVLPHPTISTNPSHKFPVSWRVKILPFIEQNKLYEAYRFDEPWDGPNNLNLLAKMPNVYQHPDAKPDSTETNYVVLTGEETVFQPKKAGTFTNIPDGTAYTILAVETKASVPWTKPEDLEYNSSKPLPTMGGFSEEGFHAAFADGSVRFMAKSMKESLLRAMITARGGEVATE